MNSEVTKPNFVRTNMSLFTVKLIECLRAGKVGDVLTDEKLSAICEKDVSPNGAGYTNLDSAKKYVEREYGLVWKRIYGEGCLKCIGAAEIVANLESEVRSAGRRMRRAADRSTLVDVSSLPEADRPAAYAVATQARMMAIFSHRDTRKQLQREERVEVDSKKLLDAVMKQFA